MKSYISTVIITQLSLLTLIVFVTKNKVLPKRVKTGIITASALIMVCAFAEFSGVLLDGAATVLKPLHIVVKYIEFCVAPIIPLVFSYAFYPMKSKEMIFLPPIIHIAFETLSLFLGIIFYIDDKNVYHHGELYWLYYRAYLSMLTSHHTIPVVISEFGVSTGRGMAHRDLNTNRNQGNMSEKDQGQALIRCYEDIMAAGCAGSCVFSWQDEWFKRTWNTMYAVNLTRNPYWSDYQTNEQYFGLLSFDPGKEKSVCYADGDISEWSGEKPVVQSGDMSVSIRYDERFMYFLIYKKNLDFENDKIFIPIDTTPKSGSNYCENLGLKFDKAADFVLVINGKDNSRLMVQERYEVLRSTYSQNLKGFDTYLVDNVPDKNSSKFVNIDMILEIFNVTEEQRHSNLFNFGEPSFETGKLRYGNANPDSADFDSLADFAQSGDYIEVKLPWQLLNFSDPSKMEILDDYYAGNYGIKFININKMNIGIMTESSNRCHLSSFELKGWGNKVTYHERLKNSYYLLQSYWNKEVSP